MSDATKHTPGPWQWVFRDRVTSLVHPHKGWLTVMDFVRLGMQGGTCRFAVWKGDERENMGGIMKPAHELDVAAHPDARLIAAAPTLYESAAEMLAELEREYGHGVRNGYWPDMAPKLARWRAAVGAAGGPPSG